MQFKKYKIKLTPISPIHIGTGDFYLPINYVIDKDGDKDYLYAFDEFSFFRNLSQKDKDEFSKILSDTTILGILKAQQFVKDRANIAKKIAYKQAKALSKIAKEYHEKIGRFAKKDDETINQMMIEKTYTSPNLNKAIIPGSSLKGAISTALGKTKLSNFIVNDSQILSSNTFVDEAINIKRKNDIQDKKSENNNLKVKMEAITTKSVFQTDFTLKDGININEIIKSCNRHYLPIFKSQFSYETDDNTRLNLDPKFIENYENFTPNENQFLVRIGKHSGNRAVTIDSTNKETTDNKNEETTTWIINKQPFGWLLCEILN